MGPGDPGRRRDTRTRRKNEIETGLNMTEAERIELAISAIEGWRNRLQSLAVRIARGPLFRVKDPESDRKKCLAKIEALEWVLELLSEWRSGQAKASKI